MRAAMLRESLGFMVDMAHDAGLLAAGVDSNAVLQADVVTSTTHKPARAGSSSVSDRSRHPMGANHCAFRESCCGASGTKIANERELSSKE
jgi:hypothetical protein